MAKVKLWDGVKWVVTDAANAETLGGQLPSYYATAADLLAHINDRNNPHKITPIQIGAETPAGAQTRVDNHAKLTTVHGATAAPTASRIIMRNALGQAQVNLAVAAKDITNKDYVDKGDAAVKKIAEDGTASAKAHADSKDSTNRTWTTTQVNNAKDVLNTRIDGIRMLSTALKLHTTTSDPSGVATGQIWLRTDL